MSTMTFFAKRAARTDVNTNELNLSSLTELAPTLVVAVVMVLMLNAML